MRYIGIDLAWTYKNESGVCLIDESGEIIFLDAKIYTDEDIVSIIEKFRIDKIKIAIDAPLIVNNEDGSREAEKSLSSQKINGHRVRAFNSNRKFLNNVFKTIRGEELCARLIAAFPELTIGLNSNESIIYETFPTGICAGLFPEIYPIHYKRKKGMTFEETIERMNILCDKLRDLEQEGIISNFSSSFKLEKDKLNRKSYKHMEDKMDAILCALGMYLIDQGWAKELDFGNLTDGYIMIPEKV
ncbi:MAG TPA: DUF429 domain-containing protein [Candidatus Jeotgalicoccus stercoravium]|nr:DUF429 domain-containing protein [Candidatus Jeotgalicoccus stercoravium]